MLDAWEAFWLIICASYTEAEIDLLAHLTALGMDLDYA